MSISLYCSATLDSAALREDFSPWCEIVIAAQVPAKTEQFALWLDRSGLALLAPGFKSPFRLRDEALRARQTGRSELLRACGPLSVEDRVLDPFAGFGMDALMLATSGCSVTAIECQPIVWLMLRDFARRTRFGIQSSCSDGLVHLLTQAAPSASGDEFDVVYLDPMFDQRRKQALPNRGLQHLRALSEDVEIDLEACIEAARRVAKRRVVLKRRLKDPVQGQPSHQILGHAVRFDVYS